MSQQSILSIQVSRRRQERIERVANDALTRAGRPYLRWAIYVKDSPGRTVAHIFKRGVFLEELKRYALEEEDADVSATMNEIVRRISLRSTEIPEIVHYDGGGLDLCFVTTTGDDRR